MALIAGLREVGRDVIRICRPLIVLQVAVHAGAARDVVVAERRVMAVGTGARRNRVQARQRESGGGVIKLAIGPGDRVMALLTGRWESRMGHRRRRRVVVVLMATDAGYHRDVVVIVCVAIAALPRRNGVRPSQRKTGF